MKNIGTGDGTLRGLVFGTALALVMILGMNALGHWDQTHKETVADSVFWMSPR